MIEEKDKNETPKDKLWGLAWEVEDIHEKKRRIEKQMAVDTHLK